MKGGMAAAPETTAACLAFVRRICRGFQTQSGHDSVVIPQLQILRAVPGRVDASLTIASTNLNRLGSLHGGCIATLTDTMGSLAIASRGLYSTGVSTDINTTYVKSGGGVGDTIHLSGHLVSIGKTLAFTRMEVTHPVTNALLAYGSHTKYIAKAITHPENVTFDQQGITVIKGKQPQEWQQDVKASTF